MSGNNIFFGLPDILTTWEVCPPLSSTNSSWTQKQLLCQ